MCVVCPFTGSGWPGGHDGGCRMWTSEARERQGVWSMFIGSTMFVWGSDYFSPTIARGGLGAVFSAELLALSSVGTQVVIEVQHKNVEDLNFVALGSIPALTAVGVDFVNLTGIKEQVRFKYTVSGPTPMDGVLVNMLAPAWRPY